MSSKIILFGATGYTGHMVAEAMVTRGLAPVLCGRNKSKLEAMAEKLGGLDIAVADVDDPQGLAAILEKGDVLVSTVGPFLKYGHTAVLVALEKGAVYIDSTGEPAFIKEIFDMYHRQSRATGATLITACGYDYIPGNCAAGLALNAVGKRATRVDIGYFSKSKGEISPLDMSQGTVKSLMMSMVTPIKVWTSGEYKIKTSGTKVRRFNLGGLKGLGLSISSTEQFSLPKIYSHLRDINTYLGWFGKLTRAMQLGAIVQSVLNKIPGYIFLASYLLSRLPESKGNGPNAELRKLHETHVVAEVFDDNGTLISRADLVGIDGYTFTARFIAWAAHTVLNDGLLKNGAIGPIQAFGIDKLKEGCEQSGLKAVVITI